VTCLHESELARFEFARHERVRVHRGVDLVDEARVTKLFADAEGGMANAPGLWGSIHIAGGFSMSPVEDTSKEAFVAQMQQNALTCFLCCREAVRAMRKTGKGGRIVNVAARPGLIPELGAGMVAYTASKAAVAALTQAIGAEVAKDGILVNAVAPSIMDTPANRKAMPGADHDLWPKTGEVAETIVFLASPENRVTRGGLVPVYGKA
jgi:NAD(P)-dependent dehydrogenase (short-subunit alcohol dehydrogenase family)